MVAVQWYERLCESGDGERLEFVMGERQVDVINSTELRLAGFALAEIGVLPAGVTDGIESASVSEEERVIAPTEVRCEFLKSSFFVVAVFLCSKRVVIRIDIP